MNYGDKLAIVMATLLAPVASHMHSFSDAELCRVKSLAVNIINVANGFGGEK